MTSRFDRERVRHEPRRRRLRVARATALPSGLRRITLTGEELAGFAAAGSADHVKLFFPDPATGRLDMPAPGEPGRPPERGNAISRDYTPLAFRAEGPDGPELDIDFVLHGDEGPASAWAASAGPGDEIGVAGPRGSVLAPTGIDDAVLVADETALPAVRRWLDALAVPVTVLLTLADEAARGYLDGAPDHALHSFAGDDRQRELEAAVRALPIGEGTFCFLAGEAGSLVPIRRHLRHERGLPKEQVDAHGYWKRGVVALDHHAPIDPGDPD